MTGIIMSHEHCKRRELMWVNALLSIMCSVPKMHGASLNSKSL